MKRKFRPGMRGCAFLLTLMFTWTNVVLPAPTAQAGSVLSGFLNPGFDTKLLAENPFGLSVPYQYINRPVPPEYNVVSFHPDEWMTFQIGVTLGPLGSAPSSIEGSYLVDG